MTAPTEEGSCGAFKFSPETKNPFSLRENGFFGRSSLAVFVERPQAERQIGAVSRAKLPGASFTVKKAAGGAAVKQFVDLRILHAGFAKHFASVLAQARRVAPVFGLRLVPFRWHGHRAEAPFARVLDGAKVADGLEVRIGHDVVEAVHALHRDV